jgi:hypothetical protein
MGGSGEEKRLKFLAMIDIKGIVCPALHVLPSGHKKAPDWREVPVEINLWRPRRGSNPQPSVPKTDALSN